jgi:hypothetical protein
MHLQSGPRSNSGSTSANPIIPSSRPMYRCAAAALAGLAQPLCATAARVQGPGRAQLLGTVPAEQRAPRSAACGRPTPPRPAPRCATGRRRVAR